jgi:murein DD-endopeptidase MepM/ murein hydrolase activator NlpD
MNQRKFTVIMCFAISIMGLLFIMMVREYCFFKQQAHILCQLQKEYRYYADIFKKKINDDLIPQAESREKKKSFDQLTFDECGKSQSTTSSDLMFTLLNRNPSYLKQSLTTYAHQESGDFFLGHIDTDCFTAYTEQLLEELETTSKKHSISEKSATDSSFGYSINKKKHSFQTHMRVKNNDVLALTLQWPIEKGCFWLSSFFGPRKKPNGRWGYHQGIDMAALRGTAVKAAASGTIIEAHRTKGYGKTVVISHDKKCKTRYAHLDTILVQAGNHVLRNQIIGRVGDTGLVRKRGKDASHLHFEVYFGNKQINPMYFLN